MRGPDTGGTPVKVLTDKYSHASLSHGNTFSEMHRERFNHCEDLTEALMQTYYTPGPRGRQPGARRLQTRRACDCTE